jgi:DNA-binding NtrC family response regulator
MSGTNVPLVNLVAIDDDPVALELIEETLAQESLEIATATDPEEGLRLVRSRRPQIVLVDLMMPGASGLDVLERILKIDPGIDVILITGHYSTESAVAAIQKGASDYLQKPLATSVLRQRIEKLADEARKRRLALQLDDEASKTFQFEGMVSRSPLMLQVFERIRRVAPHFRTALIVGATGTGKELAARALHSLSPAAAARFVACNCSAIVETLFESELFGHVKGSFTGATQDKVGFLEFAAGGVLFLDEIGDMPLACQHKMLRVLENHEFQRVGSPAVHRTDVRIVTATNRNLRERMSRGLFREDLFYRLSMIEIELPCLAERKEDLPYLQRHFLDRFALQYNKSIRGISNKAQILLASYSWPGNVRELENVLGHACMMNEDGVVCVRDLPPQLQKVSPETAPQNGDLVPLAELHKSHVLRALERAGGNKALAARFLGINRTTLYRILKKSRDNCTPETLEKLPPHQE